MQQDVAGVAGSLQSKHFGLDSCALSFSIFPVVGSLHGHEAMDTHPLNRTSFIQYWEQMLGLLPQDTYSVYRSEHKL